MSVAGFFTGVLLLIAFWFLAVAAVLYGAFRLATIGYRKPKPSRARNRSGPPPTAQIDAELYRPKPRPVYKPAPAYVRKWNRQRRAWVIADKFQWQSEFDQIG